jgi:hypothetical protein
MKITIIALIVVFPFVSYCQDTSTTKPKTKIQGFLSSTSVVLKKEFINEGEVRNVTIEVMKITNVKSGNVISGVRFSGYTSGK